MNKIEIEVLNPEALAEAEKLMVCAARLTQRGHQIKNLTDFMSLYNKDYLPETACAMARLPHPTIQKFGVVNVVVVGASRRFLAQITRHQNEVKFMSASLQYSNYSGESDFTVPYEIFQGGPVAVSDYLAACQSAMQAYADCAKSGAGQDAAGYLAPQGLRNVLIISATPYQWKHMICQRTCRRNTNETRYVMLRIWERLNRLAPELFCESGPFCTKGCCPEGKMTCGEPIGFHAQPADILLADFPLLCREVPK